MASTWPVLEYEAVPWVGDGPAGRTALGRHSGPYRAAIPTEIAEAELALPAEVVAAADEASRELAGFDTELGEELDPFEAVLQRVEAVASSRIENVAASARAVAEAELGSSVRRNADEIVGNIRAMTAAYLIGRGPIEPATVLAVHAALMDATEPRIAGVWRDQQVWIGGSSLGPHSAEFVPPHHARLPAAMDDWVRFTARDDLPLLAQAAVAHAQFETIHPFFDGNGRTGRALLHSLLRAKGLTPNVTVPVSVGLLGDTELYYEALRAYRRGEPRAIVERVVEAGRAGVIAGTRLVEDLRALRSAWRSRLVARYSSTSWRLLDVLLRQPVIHSRLVATELDILRTNVYRAIYPLVKYGILVEFADRRRDRVWWAPEVLDLLDGFAARAARGLGEEGQP